MAQCMEEEARDILRDALMRKGTHKPLGQQIHQVFAGIGFVADELIPELRGSAARPASFDEKRLGRS